MKSMETTTTAKKTSHHTKAKTGRRPHRPQKKIFFFKKIRERQWLIYSNKNPSNVIGSLGELRFSVSICVYMHIRQGVIIRETNQKRIF